MNFVCLGRIILGNSSTSVLKLCLWGKIGFLYAEIMGVWMECHSVWIFWCTHWCSRWVDMPWFAYTSSAANHKATHHRRWTNKTRNPIIHQTQIICQWSLRGKIPGRPIGSLPHFVWIGIFVRRNFSNEWSNLSEKVEYTMFEIHRKSLIQHCERSELCLYIF